jgi:hypothetical protein
MMAWVAMDRAVKSVEQGWVPDPATEKWRNLRDKIHADVCNNGFDAELNSFVQFYGSKHLDASLLMMAMVGFLPANDPRIRGTVDAIEKHLLSDNGFVNRSLSTRKLTDYRTGRLLPFPALSGSPIIMPSRDVIKKRAKSLDAYWPFATISAYFPKNTTPWTSGSLEISRRHFRISAWSTRHSISKETPAPALPAARQAQN